MSKRLIEHRGMTPTGTSLGFPVFLREIKQNKSEHEKLFDPRNVEDHYYYIFLHSRFDKIFFKYNWD